MEQMDGNGRIWKDKDCHGYSWMVMDIHGWTRNVMESQMNDIAWHKRAYTATVMERLEMAWKFV